VLSGTSTPADPTGSAFLMLLVASVAALLFMNLPRRRKDEPTGD
jgi:hypothetical protein